MGPGYQVIRKIGEGNYGEVWLAEAPGGIEVALKCIRFPIGHEINDREFRGLQLMKNMRHPFLLQVQAFWAVDNQLVIAMELADGSLGQLLNKQRRQTLSRKELLRYFGEAAEGIDYLHQHNVVHRDIKPDNILLLKGHAKVADFGLARFIDETGLSTAATQLAGSPAYMAPEVWTQRYQPASDQYSLAITYFELRTGRLPFQSRNPYEAMQDHLHRAPDLSDLPKDERRIIRRALAKNPAKRYRNCAALIDALAQSETPRRAATGRPVANKFLWLLLPTVIALTAVFVTALVTGFRNRDSQQVWLPPEGNFVAASLGPPVQVDGRWLHERIARQLPGGGSLSFALIQVAPNADLRSFYMLETEVPNYAFAQFAEAQPQMVGPESQRWKDGALAGERLLGVEGDQANLPVVSVSRDTALACAQWLGGTLPSVQQWDAAAGLGRADWHEPGPYRSEIVSEEEYAVQQVARIQRGPAAIGTSPDDESPFWIRDMAGNVDEWTSDFTNASVALQCWIRGNSYDEQDRWRFDDVPRSRPRNEARESSGFRVVLRIPSL